MLSVELFPISARAPDGAAVRPKILIQKRSIDFAWIKQIGKLGRSMIFASLNQKSLLMMKMARFVTVFTALALMPFLSSERT
jgi:hypothetical protein